MGTDRVRTRTLIFVLTTGFVAVSLLVTVLVLRQVLVSDIGAVTDRSLQTQGQDLTRLFTAGRADVEENPGDLAQRILTEYYQSDVTDLNESLLVVDGDEILAAVGPELTGLSPTIAELTATIEDEPSRLADGSSDQGPIRILVRQVGQNGSLGSASLVIALSVDDQRDFIDRAFRDALLAALGTLLVAFPLAWLAAGRAFRPIELLADTAQDITANRSDARLAPQGTAEMAHLIESFNEMVDRLEQAVKEQRRFLNDASHELRTPLTVIRGHLEVAGQPDDETNETDDVRTIALTELDRMGRIVDDLLVLARSNQIDFLRFGPVDSDDFMSSIMARVSGMSDHNWVMDAMPLGVFDADGQRLDQVMLNLCVNAARHTPPGGEIGLGAQLDTHRFRMWVRDTGEGIDPADHQRIFERFQRGSTERSPAGGAGLGLSIVKAVAEAHNGRVSVASEPGAGSTFTVEIPAGQSPQHKLNPNPPKED